MMEFARWLRQKREKNGYTQTFVAKQLHISRQGVSKWENGNARPSYEMLHKIFCLYQCTEPEIKVLFDKVGENKK